MTRFDDVLPDLLRPGLDLVICGTAAGNRFAAIGAYYAGRGNRFWRILAETRLTPSKLNPIDFGSLPDLGIGLTDLAKRARGMDSGLNANDFDTERFWRSIKSAQPGVLAFNGKKAAKVALEKTHVENGRQSKAFGLTQLFVLPSTSGANAHWTSQPWHECAQFVLKARC